MPIVNIFPLAILEASVTPETAQAVEDFVVPQVDLLKQSEDTFDTYKTDYWETKIKVHESVPQLWDEILEYIKEYSEETTIAVNFDGLSMHYWTQEYKEGDSHDMHAHGCVGISGIYWVRANEAAGPVRIYSPNPYTELTSWNDMNNPFSRSVVDVYPKKGKLILFPSYLQHRVMPSGKNAERTTIAFNVK